MMRSKGASSISIRPRGTLQVDFCALFAQLECVGLKFGRRLPLAMCTKPWSTMSVNVEKADSARTSSFRPRLTQSGLCVAATVNSETKRRSSKELPRSKKDHPRRLSAAAQLMASGLLLYTAIILVL
jgi:hypothetical protein